MQVRLYEPADRDAVIALWARCDLLRPWNDPVADIELCRVSPSSALFVGEVVEDGGAPTLVAAVMSGADGHRGWLYLLAVDPDRRRAGYARALVLHAEAWLARQGIAKVNLMIREENAEVRAFYERLGYGVEERVVMARRLDGREHP